MAAMALVPLSAGVSFVLDAPLDERCELDPSRLDALLEFNEHIRIYGLTWAIWTAFATAPVSLAEKLRTRRIDFVHSGGWKKLEALAVPASKFDATLLAMSGPGSSVVDFYGLVEQVGVIFPACAAGARHIPRWAQVVIRDPITLAPIDDGVGLLQLLNPLARGAPYASVLTEDLGEWVRSCSCVLGGRAFVLRGRLPASDVRGCGNV
jgi:hypothetical protein